MRLGLALVLSVTLAGSLSCASRVAGPPPVPDEDIRFELVASGGSPGEPATIRGVIRNAGGKPVDPFDPCPDPYIRIYDARQNELLQLDPTVPVACPLVQYAPLAPGSRMELSLAFDGRYYTGNGDRLEAPPGTYTAVATFRYGLVGSSETRTLIRDVRFAWR